MSRINKRVKPGRPAKLYHKNLGGIPMIIKDGRVAYAERVPYGVHSNELEHKKAAMPIGTGSFIRRHIFDMRFPDESEQDRQKREYREWAEETFK